MFTAAYGTHFTVKYVIDEVLAFDAEGGFSSKSLPATVTTPLVLVDTGVTVNPTNNAPVIYAQTFVVTDTVVIGTFVGEVVATDSDAGQTLS